MFTGLIEEIGIVKAIEKSGTGMYLTVTSNVVIDDIKTGDSISIDGACLTVTKFTEDSFTVFASKVTCEATTLGFFKAGRKVNLERAMSANARFGGHIVQGHVDGRGKIRRIIKEGNGSTIEITVPEDIFRYIVVKGSISIDGISFTVVSLMSDGIIIHIIPETAKNTSLSEKTQGAEVNIEVDILAKYVEKMIGPKQDDRQKEDKNLKRTLLEEGFL